MSQLQVYLVHLLCSFIFTIHQCEHVACFNVLFYEPVMQGNVNGPVLSAPPLNILYFIVYSFVLLLHSPIQSTPSS